jgi:hypothetical protein
MDRHSHRKVRDLTKEELASYERFLRQGYDSLNAAHDIWMKQYLEVPNRKETSSKAETPEEIEKRIREKNLRRPDASWNSC